MKVPGAGEYFDTDDDAPSNPQADARRGPRWRVLSW